MGSGIAYVCASKGFSVRLSDISQELVQKGIRNIENIVRSSVKKGRISEQEGSNIQNAVEGSIDMKFATADTDLVVEAVYEDLGVKKEVFRRLEEICAGTTIFATNTSSLSVRSIASAVGYRDRFLGLHFFNPPQAMRLVEMVVTPETSQGTV